MGPRGQAQFWVTFEAQQREFGGLVGFAGVLGPPMLLPSQKILSRVPLCFDFSSLLRGVFILPNWLFSTSAYFWAARFWAQITRFWAISRFRALGFSGFLGPMLDFNLGRSRPPILNLA
jgi:hypothetical protein